MLRYASDSKTTLSLVSIDGIFECYGLEDEYREEKVYGETRISAGTYNIGLRKVGGFHSRYLRRFPDIHRGMLEIEDVPNFEHILIHVGNSEKDTAGCLLVGQGVKPNKTVTHSVNAYKALYSKVVESAISGNLTINFIDGDRKK